MEVASFGAWSSPLTADVLRDGWSARTRVHEHGGGAVHEATLASFRRVLGLPDSEGLPAVQIRHADALPPAAGVAALPSSGPGADAG
jgi:hypothetical protein